MNPATAAIVCLALGAGCATGSAKPTPPTRSTTGVELPLGAAPPASPNVLVVTLCSTRADHVGAYGYAARDTTPILDLLASQGITFDHLWSGGSWTPTSHATIFTGLFPGHHELLDERQQLTADHPQLQEILSLYGYRSAALIEEVSPVSMSPDYGLLRGFDSWWGIRKGKDFDPGKLTAWLSQGDGPWYGFVHLREAHFPYGEGQPFVDGPRGPLQDALAPHRMTLAEAAAHGVDQRAMSGIYPWIQHYVGDDPDHRAELDLAYDSGLRAADTSLGVLLQDLQGQGLLDSTVVIVVGGHGEALVDGYARNNGPTIGHKDNISRGNLHVPLVVRFPDGRAAGSHIDDTVGHVDLLPTILELVGATPPADHDGRSLLPLLQGDSLPARPALTQVRMEASGPQAMWESVAQGDQRIVGFPGEHRWTLLQARGATDELVRTDDPSGLKASLASWRDSAAAGSSVGAPPTRSMTPEQEAIMRRDGYWTQDRDGRAQASTKQPTAGRPGPTPP